MCGTPQMSGIFLKGGIFIMDFLRKHKKKIRSLILITRLSIKYYDEIESFVYFLIGLIYKRSFNEPLQMHSI